MSLITPDHLSAFREGLGTKLDTGGLDNPGKAKRRVSYASTEGLCNYENRQRLATDDSVPRNVNSIQTESVGSTCIINPVSSYSDA